MKRGFGNLSPAAAFAHGQHHKRCQRQGVPVLTYFPSAGLAHYTRLLFTIGEVDYIDRRVTHEEFLQKYKAYSPTGQLPMLEVGEETLTQSSAIAMYAASRANLLPECPFHMAKAVSIQSIFDELRSEAAVEGSKFLEPSERYAKLAPWFTANFPNKFEMVKTIIETIPATAGSPFIFGKMSFVDVVLHSSFKTVKDWLGEDLYKTLCNISERMTEAAKAIDELPATTKLLMTYSEPKLTLHYFNMDGRATPIRWALAYGKIAYEEKTFSFDEWIAEYHTLSPTGRAPWMTLQSACGKVETLAETNAILAYVGAKAKLAPKNPLDAAHMYGVIQSADNITDMLSTTFKLKKEGKDEEIKVLAEHLNSGPLAAAVKRLEDHIKLRADHSGYVVGGRLTIADLMVAGVFRFLNSRPYGLVVTDLWTAYPHLLKVFQRVMQYPEFQNSLMIHNKKPTYGYFNLHARDTAIRFINKHANLEQEWITFDFEQWSSTYKKVPVTGTCPYMDIDGKMYYETIPLLKWAAERAGLIPYHIETRAIADALASIYVEVISVMALAYVAPPGDERKKLIDENRSKFDQKMNILETVASQTASTEGYLVENHLTWIDFYLAGELEWGCTSGWIDTKVEEKWPCLGKSFNMIFSLPCAKRD